MPVQTCHSGGQPGFKWGESGKCYKYRAGDAASRQRAWDRAVLQGRAQIMSEKRRGVTRTHR
jgi:hypothetical protein